MTAGAVQLSSLVQVVKCACADLMNSNLMTVKANLNETLTTTSTLLANLTAGDRAVFRYWSHTAEIMFTVNYSTEGLTVKPVALGSVVAVIMISAASTVLL